MIATSLSADLKPLRELVTPRPQRPETVLTLETAVSDRLGTIRSFELPPSVKRHFEEVLDAVAEGGGRGFWVQSEYGGGKTHFIAALTALLGQSPAGPRDAEVWAAVTDPEVRSQAHNFVGKRLLPVTVSCKGIMPISGEYARALLNLLMTGLERALDASGLAERIPVRDEDELYYHYQGRPSELRQSIDAWSRQQYQASIADLYDDDPLTAANAYSRWCRDVAGAAPDTDVSVVDWLVQFCRRLRQEGFDGMLVVIDEFATLQNLATASPDVAAYEDVLEALGWLAPGRLREDDRPFGLYTVVASQKGHPTKLAQRFASILLLAQNAQQDYEIIVSRRVRTLQADRLDDIDRYYTRLRLSHAATYAAMTRERFREVFPFQPRVFDAIWRITAAGGEVAAARFGIAAVWGALREQGVLEDARLLTVSELLRSEQFQSDLRATPEYREAFITFQAAQESAGSLGFTETDSVLAARVLDALFVDYLAFRRSPRRLSTQELAEAVLADSGSAVMTAGDQVLRILSRLKQLRQVDFDAGQGAQFRPEAGGGPTPTEVLNKAVNDLDAGEAITAQTWAALLTHAGNPPGLFGELRPDVPKAVKVPFQRVLYGGTVELRQSLDRLPDLPAGAGRHFSLLLLGGPAEVTAEALADARLAVIVPGKLTEAEIVPCRRYLACEQVLNDPRLLTGPGAGELKVYVQAQRQEAVSRLVSGQRGVFRRGRVVTKTGLALEPDSLFRNGGWLDAVNSVAEGVLGAAYSQIGEGIKPALFRRAGQFDPAVDSGKVFAGLFAGSTQAADVGAAQNYGPGLGLSLQSAPTVLAPDRERFGIGFILQRLAAQPAGIRTADLYDALCGPPYGVPPEVVTLWLLACVARTTVGAEGRRLELKLQSGARTRLANTRGPVPNGVITSLNVNHLEWTTNLRGELAQLRCSDEAPFGEVVAYGKVLDPNLKVPAEAGAVEDQEQRLQREFAGVRARALTTRQEVADLAAVLGSGLPAEAQSTLERLGRALAQPAGYDRQAALGQLRDAYPAGPEELDHDWRRLQGWEALASRSTNLATLQRSLRDMVSRLERQPGSYAMLVTTAETQVLPRFDIASLLATPSAAESVVQAARGVYEGYVTEYRIHHRDYYEAGARLEADIQTLRERTRVLGQLNTIKRAGPPTASDAAGRLETLARRLNSCPRPADPALPSGALVCEVCHLEPLAEPPVKEIDQLRREIEGAIRARVNAIKAAAIQQALAQATDPGIGSFLAAIQAGQFEGLLDVLDDALVATINRVLEQAAVVTVQSPLFRKLAERYPTIQKAQIGQVTDAFRTLLEETFAEQERTQPDAAVQVQLGQ